MKKTYIAPTVETYEVQSAALMAQSLGISSDPSKTVDTSNGEQLGRDNSSNSNLWDQEW